MKPNTIPTAASYSALAVAATASFLLPDTLSVPQAAGYPDDPATMTLGGIVHDFDSSHADFDVMPVGGWGHYAGNIDLVLGDAYRPELATPDTSGDDGDSGSSGSSSDERARIATGTYTGNGSSNRDISGLAFQPDFVIIKSDSSSCYAIARSSTMSNTVELSRDESLQSNRIKTLSADGFRVGSDDDSNDNGKAYFWIAFAEAEGKCDVGTYTAGNNSNDHDVAGVGFRPDFVIVIPDGSETAYLRADAMPTNQSVNFAGGNLSTSRIRSFTDDGFRVGTNNDVNEDSDTYHYVAWRSSGYMATGRYQGEGGGSAPAGDDDDNDGYGQDDGGGAGGLADRSITVGFEPAFVLIANNRGEEMAQRMDSVAGDMTLRCDSYDDYSNGIKSLDAAGFTIGTDSRVSSAYSSHHFYWMAFADEPDSSSSSSSGGSSGGSTTVAYTGTKIDTQWLDRLGNPIAPHMDGVGGFIDTQSFQLVDQTVVPDQQFAIMVTVLGAAIETSSYHAPVTTRVNIGGTAYDLFGSYDQPVEGNVNDDQTETGSVNPGSNARDFILPSLFPAGTAVSIQGRSWLKKSSGNSGLSNSHWEEYMAIDSASNSDRSVMLINNDAVPAHDALHDQASIAAYLDDFIDPASGRVSLCDNQAIFLFELGSSTDGDFQDLVVLVSFAQVTGDLPAAASCGANVYDPCGDLVADAAGTRGVIDSGAITSAATFDDWFRDVPGTNDAILHKITLTDTGSGVFEFVNDEFFPIDGKLMGNEGMAHNFYFTYILQAEFTYTECTDLFIEFEGNDDVWCFIDDTLVLDLGGMKKNTPQYIDLDRVGLTDGDTVTWRLFFAQRQGETSQFRIRTNLPLSTDNYVPVSSAQYD